ncbi:TetR family transcriptional regulator [Mycobacterium sp. IDR2000157661]|uniref:TetR family transcriptional regulator n=1 Tax=Mycobacterium sp. IDR2000157661 TaxID=2867005 RepID=UPI001EEC3DBB|nr:TetR family transcriptional regulator [Mycobacterium sp. IDR2000157661]ULE34513.1 TetR family transcriptional regulator [Mycobacterium sp. IDR2000157661]
MGVTHESLGLRDRKKLRTRDTIRREAIRLIEANGYAATTIEQIAEAADISPSTFFRYFPTKEAVLMADDLQRLFLAVLARQPATLSSLAAFRSALEIAVATLSESDWAFERARQRVVFSVPELKAAQFDAYLQSSKQLVATESRRLRRDLDELEARAFYAALTGALIAAIDRAQGSAEGDMYRVLDFVEAGMPVSSGGEVKN